MKKYIFLIITSCLFLSKLNAEEIYYNNELRKANPDRVEKMSYGDISKLIIDQSYGNIILQNTDSKEIEVEIRYFDGNKNKAGSNMKVSSRVLSITTQNAGKDGSQIDYIIAVPKNIELKLDLKYGNIKIDKYSGGFVANLSYSDLNATELSSAKAEIKGKYSDVKINKADDLNLSMEYSDVVINTLNTLKAQGNYTDFRITNIQTITASSQYGEFKLGAANIVNANLKYSDIIIDNLESSIIAQGDYSDIKIKNSSKQLKNMNIKGHFSDVSVRFDPELSADFHFDLNYGDLDIPKKYPIKYNVSEEGDNNIVKKGTLGSKTPTANIFISTTYADITIK